MSPNTATQFTPMMTIEQRIKAALGNGKKGFHPEAQAITHTET